MPYSFTLPIAPTITPATDVIPIAYPNGYIINGYVAGTFKIGVTYTIQTLGNTNFTLIGATANTVGLSFVATGIGSGTGTASAKEYVLYATIAQILGLGRGAPVTKTANFTVADTENWLINNKSGSSCTVTLPTASSYIGREIMIQNWQAQTVVSASSNVIPLAGGSASSSILSGTAGKRATLVSNGTNWQIVDSN
jgi:hypothetical protein